jgi:hypothetical protein
MTDASRPRPTEARPTEARPTEARPTDPQRRRRRVRLEDPPGATTASVDGATGAETAPLPDEPSTWPTPEIEGVAAERGLRGIVGGGSSQVTPGAALRARDAARPRPADLARAEAELTIIRRNWAPRE